MRLMIRHETAYTFETPPASVIQTLRLSPRSHDGQHVVNWRLDVDRNCRLKTSEDAFGNQTHVFVVDGPLDSLSVLVEGEVDTQDTGGVVSSAVERFPPDLYLRGTDLTAADLEIAALAAEIAEKAKGDRLSTLHELLRALHEDFSFDEEPTETGTATSETFRTKRGTSEALTHLFLAVSRRMGAPARYVSGYVRREGEDAKSFASAHAWAEAHVPGLGWVGFDPALGLCVTEAHVRVAIGLDALGAAPVRGTRYGGSGETFVAKVEVTDARARRVYRHA